MNVLPYEEGLVSKRRSGAMQTIPSTAVLDANK